MADIKRLNHISRQIVKTYKLIGGINRIDKENLPSQQRVIEIMKDILILIFPGYIGDKVPTRETIHFLVNGLTDSLYVRLVEEIERSLVYVKRLKNKKIHSTKEEAERRTLEFLKAIPGVREQLKEDIQAAYEGDPAAISHDEIIICYPGILAIATYRIAHILYINDIPLIPRIMTEWAHAKTGIDIHPGATIGKRFFIDHGTGVVIGETTKIGSDVKIYQGVTLGALSFPKDKSGRIIKGGKRHPTIEDQVTIYAGATILGGKTVIGKGAIIGANSWLIESVPPGTLVTISVNQEFREKRKKSVP